MIFPYVGAMGYGLRAMGYPKSLEINSRMLTERNHLLTAFLIKLSMSMTLMMDVTTSLALFVG